MNPVRTPRRPEPTPGVAAYGAPGFGSSGCSGEGKRMESPRIDPEFAALIPPHSKAEHDGLEADIIADGCRDPLIVWEGTLLDGHNRHAICEAHGIEYRTVERKCSSRADAMLFILRLQAHRHNLSKSQKANCALKVLPLLEALAKERQGARTDITEIVPQSPGEARQEAATMFDVNAHYVSDMKKIAEENPELVEAIENRELTIPQAKKKAKKEKKAATKAAVEAAAAADPVGAVTVKPGEWWQLGRHRLYCGDTSGEEFIAGCPPAAFAFADPPYGAGVAEWDGEFVWEHDWLSERAKVVGVTPGGWALFEFARKTRMPYRWMLACWVNNGMTHGAIGFANWIGVTIFAAEKIHTGGQDFTQVTISPAETDDTSHKGRKPSGLMAWLLDTFTKPGDTVLDPFAGSGTTLIACEASDRVCVTGELDPTFCADIITRWQGVTGEVASVD
jgi:DNA modification methylase